MAVLQGTRLRTGAVPSARPTVARPHVAPAVAPKATSALGSRVRPIGLLMAGIVIATMLGMVYLTQTLGANAATSSVLYLEDKREEYRQEAGRQSYRILQHATDDHVRAAARRLGLKDLGEAVVLAAP